MPDVVVTGGAGYVGTRLVTRLLDEGYDVRVIDTFPRGYDALLHLVDHGIHLDVLKRDIRDVQAEDIGRPDTVYHLAALSGYTACEREPEWAVEVNVRGTLALLKALPPHVSLIYASTTSISGPQTLYATTKQRAEALVMEREGSLAVRWATLFGVSPAMRHDLLPNAFARQAVQQKRITVFSPTQRRTFMHVRDCVDAYVRIMQDVGEYLGHVWTIGDPGLTISKGALAGKIATACDALVIVEGTPDPDARDLDVALNGEGTYGLMLPHSTWAQHIPELVQFYGWHPGE